jgi:hypothetical protein
MRREGHSNVVEMHRKGPSHVYIKKYNSRSNDERAQGTTGTLYVRDQRAEGGNHQQNDRSDTAGGRAPV